MDNSFLRHEIGSILVKKLRNSNPGNPELQDSFFGFFVFFNLCTMMRHPTQNFFIGFKMQFLMYAKDMN